MIGIIAIGEWACMVAEHLSKMAKSIKVLSIRSESKSKRNMQDWEQNGALFDYPSEWNDVEEVYCVVCGYESISGATLITLQNFVHKKISIWYLTKSLLNKEEQINNKICINVLQEYTRSGALEHMFLFNVEHMMDSLLGKPEIAENNSLIELKHIVVGKICMCLYTYKQIRYEQPIDGSVLDFSNTIYRISSFFEVSNLQADKLELFYPQFKYVKCINYVLCIPVKMTKYDIDLIKFLKQKVMDSTEQCENNVSIFQENDDSYRSLIGFCSSNVIQQSIYI